jgi:uncharacterized membrane protein YhaH (DUF805 family)
MQKYFDFYGESQRSEYWAVNIIGFLVAAIGYAIGIGLIAFGSIGAFLGVVLCIAVLRDMVSRGRAFDLIKEHFGVEQ